MTKIRMNGRTNQKNELSESESIGVFERVSDSMTEDEKKKTVTKPNTNESNGSLNDRKNIDKNN